MLKCSKCGYQWETKSKLDWVTCPNCQGKTKGVNIIVKEEIEN